MPTLADIAPLQQTLASILAGEPRSHQALTVVPILALMQAEPEWRTLAEAGERVRITEVSEGGSVPDLRVANLGDPLLLLDGEQLVGAKQNRILTTCATRRRSPRRARRSRPCPGQVGALAYGAGRWAGLDLLAGPRLFATSWPRLCAGYAADALRRAPAQRQVPAPSVILDMLAACSVEPAPAVGLGTEYRLAGEQLAGATLVAEERVAHLMAFPVQSAH